MLAMAARDRNPCQEQFRTLGPIYNGDVASELGSWPRADVVDSLG